MQKYTVHNRTKKIMETPVSEIEKRKRGVSLEFEYVHLFLVERFYPINSNEKYSFIWWIVFFFLFFLKILFCLGVKMIYKNMLTYID